MCARGRGVGIRVHVALDRRVPKVLNCVVCPAGHQLGDLRPLVAELPLELYDPLLLLVRERRLVDRRV
jgi:hypothetical protein